MSKPRFFGILWRINALIIFAAGLLTIVLLLFVLRELAGEIFGTREVYSVVNTDEETVPEEDIMIESQRISGSKDWLLTLHSNQVYAQSYYSKSALAARNYGVLSPGGQPRWLYPHHRFLFSDVRQVSESNAEEKQKTRLLLFVIRKEDTDQDRRLTDADTGTLALSRADGSDFTELLTVGELVDYQLDERQLHILYRDNDNTFYSARVALADFSLLEQQSLPLPQAQ